MKKDRYITPALCIEQAEPCCLMAISFDTSKAEWKDDVNPEVKEQSDAVSNWEIDW